MEEEQARQMFGYLTSLTRQEWGLVKSIVNDQFARLEDAVSAEIEARVGPMICGDMGPEMAALFTHTMDSVRRHRGAS